MLHGDTVMIRYTGYIDSRAIVCYIYMIVYYVSRVYLFSTYHTPYVEWQGILSPYVCVTH